MPYRYITQQAQLLRSYYAGFGKPGIIYPAAFMAAFAQGAVMLGMIFFMREVFNSSPGLIGWLSAVWSLSYIAGCLAVRPLFSRARPRYLALTATGLAFAGTLAIQMAPSPAFVFPLMGLCGLAMSFFWPQIMGWLSADVEGEGLARVVGRFNLCWNAGGILSPLVAGALSDVQVRLPLYVGSAMFLATALFLAGAIMALPAARTDKPEKEMDRGPAPPSGRSTLLRYPAWVGAFAVYFGLGVLGNIFPIIAHDVLHFSRTTIGGLGLVRSFSSGIGFIALGSMAFWHFRSVPMIAGQLLGVALFLLLPLAQSVTAVAALMFVSGAVVAMGYSGSIFHGVSGSANRASRMAVHEAVISGGVVVGAGIGGMAYQRWGAAHVYWICAAVLLAGIALQVPLCAWAAAREGKKVARAF